MRRNAFPGSGICAVLLLGCGCASIRVTDPAHTATEQFLLNVSSLREIEQLSAITLRDRAVFVDSLYLTAAAQPASQEMYLLGELRARLLMDGVRLMPTREEAEVILEVRSAGVGIDRMENLLGIPAVPIPFTSTGGVPVTTPELALFKTTRQRGYASVAFVAYWAKSGEVLASSGPYVGRTMRDDWWIFGWGPRTIGDIPPAQPAPSAP